MKDPKYRHLLKHIKPSKKQNMIGIVVLIALLSWIYLRYI